MPALRKNKKSSTASLPPSKPLLEDLQDLRKPVPYLHVFSLLTTLKQICDHPCLVNNEHRRFSQAPSGKWDLFVELLDETRDSGQKLVVFSST